MALLEECWIVGDISKGSKIFVLALLVFLHSKARSQT